MANDGSELKRMMSAVAGGKDPEDMRKIKEGLENQHLTDAAKFMAWNLGHLDRDTLDADLLTPLMTKMAETSAVDAASVPQRQILYELARVCRDWGPESRKSAMRTSSEKAAVDAEQTQREDYQAFSRSYGFYVPMRYTVVADQYAKIVSKMELNMTADMNVMDRWKMANAAMSTTEKRMSLGPLGDLVQNSVDGDEAIRNGHVLARALALLIALTAAGMREVPEGKGLAATRGLVARADGATAIVNLHWNEAMLLYFALMEASAVHGPNEVKRLFKHHLNEANEAVNQSGGEVNLSTALFESLRAHTTEQVLGHPKAPQVFGGQAAEAGSPRAKMVMKDPAGASTTCLNFNSERGCARGDCKYIHRCTRCGEMGHAATRCRGRERSRSRERRYDSPERGGGRRVFERGGEHQWDARRPGVGGQRAFGVRP